MYILYLALRRVSSIFMDTRASKVIKKETQNNASRSAYTKATRSEQHPRPPLRLVPNRLPAVNDVIEDVRMNLGVGELPSRLGQDGMQDIRIAAQDLRVAA